MRRGLLRLRAKRHEVVDRVSPGLAEHYLGDEIDRLAAGIEDRASNSHERERHLDWHKHAMQRVTRRANSTLGPPREGEPSRQVGDLLKYDTYIGAEHMPAGYSPDGDENPPAYTFDAGAGLMIGVRGELGVELAKAAALNEGYTKSIFALRTPDFYELSPARRRESIGARVVATTMRLRGIPTDAIGNYAQAYSDLEGQDILLHVDEVNEHRDRNTWTGRWRRLLGLEPAEAPLPAVTVDSIESYLHSLPADSESLATQRLRRGFDLLRAHGYESSLQTVAKAVVDSPDPRSSPGLRPGG